MKRSVYFVSFRCNIYMYLFRSLERLLLSVTPKWGYDFACLRHLQPFGIPWALHRNLHTRPWTDKFCPATIPPSLIFFSHMTSYSLWIFKMASQSQGIQQLLQAEKKAETMVSEARKRKKILLNCVYFDLRMILVDMIKKAKNLPWLMGLTCFCEIDQEHFCF